MFFPCAKNLAAVDKGQEICSGKNLLPSSFPWFFVMIQLLLHLMKSIINHNHKIKKLKLLYVGCVFVCVCLISLSMQI